MKSLFVFVAFVGLVLCACKNDPNSSAFTDEGQITGFDGRKCFCCGGWFIETADTTFLFSQLPAGSTIDLDNATFPIPVTFDYQPDTSVCKGWGNRIILTYIEQR